MTGLDALLAASLRRQDLERWQRDARAQGPRAGRCGTCGQDAPELWPAYGRWQCEECYWDDSSPRDRAAREVARELGCDVPEILA